MARAMEETRRLLPWAEGEGAPGRAGGMDVVRTWEGREGMRSLIMRGDCALKAAGLDVVRMGDCAPVKYCWEEPDE